MSQGYKFLIVKYNSFNIAWLPLTLQFFKGKVCSVMPWKCLWTFFKSRSYMHNFKSEYCSISWPRNKTCNPPTPIGKGSMNKKFPTDATIIDPSPQLYMRKYRSSIIRAPPLAFSYFELLRRCKDMKWYPSYCQHCRDGAEYKASKIIYCERDQTLRAEAVSV